MKISRFLNRATLLLLLAGTGLRAEDREAIGSIRTINGPIYLKRDGVEKAVTTAERLFEGDVLRTGPGGSAGVLLRDDTAISIGPDTNIAMENFNFAPAQNRLGLVVRLFKGTMAFLSGKIAKLSPNSVKVETPVATVGIRGTYFLVQAEEK